MATGKKTKNKNPKNTKISRPRRSAESDPEVALNLTEIGADLASEANFYVKATDELPDLTGAELALQLSKMLSAETVSFFLAQGDYGRGFLAGGAVFVEALELAIDAQLGDRELVYGEGEVPEDEVEDIIYSGLKQGIFGGKKEPGNGETH